MLTTTLMKLLAPTFARAILTLILRDDVTGSDMAGQLTDSMNLGELLERVTQGDYKSQQNGERFFAQVGEEAAESLAVVFEREGEAVAQAQQEMVAAAVAETLQACTMPLLLSTALDRDAFSRALAKLPLPESLDPLEQALYERVLSQAGQRVFDFAAKLPHFTRNTTAQTLQGLATLQVDVQQIRQQVEQIYTESQRQNPEHAAADFEQRYRTALSHQLDRLDLFGISQVPNYHTPLTVAYITLAVETHQTDEDGLDLQWLFAWQERRSQVLSVPDALAQTRRALIIGDAGSGKTTLLKWIAVQATNNDFPEPLAHWHGKLPFYVRLRDFANRSLPTYDELPLTLKSLHGLRDQVPSGWADKNLDAGRAIVLLDGLDEINQAQREAVYGWLDTMQTVYKDAIFVVSTRPAALQDETARAQYAGAGFVPLRLQKLKTADIHKLVAQWHKSMGHEHSQLPNSDKEELPGLEKALQLVWPEKKRGLRELMTNPLLCAMICALHQARSQELPHDRVQLYNACIEMLVEKRDLERGVDLSKYPALNFPEKEALLAKLAYWMLRNNAPVVDQDQATEMLTTAKHSGKDVLRLLVERSSLLQALAADEYDFTHRTFQEYLAAAEIFRISDIRAVCEQATKKEWHGTIRLVAGVARTEEAMKRLIRRLTERAIEEENRTLALLAIECWQMMVLPPDECMEWLTAALAQHVEEDRKAVGLAPNPSWVRIATGMADPNEYWVYAQLQLLDLREMGMSDLSPLSDLPQLKLLDLRETGVNDLSPLSGLPQLQLLDLRKTGVSDLSPLSDLPQLQVLDLRETSVSDLTPLSHLTQLQLLDLRETGVSDLIPLSLLPQLQLLYLSRTDVSDLTPLSHLPHLQWLDLSQTSVSDLTPLSDLPHLQLLYLSQTDMSELTPLSHLPQLQLLDLKETSVSELTPLSHLPQLQLLDLSQTGVSDLTPLSHLPQLLWLDLSQTGVSDLTPLSGLTQLQWLSLTQTGVRDLTTLSHLPQLQVLDLRGVAVDKWCSLEGLGTLQAVWVDDPDQVPQAWQAQLKVNPEQGPFEYWQALQRA